MFSYQWLILLSAFMCVSGQAGGEGSGGTVFSKLSPLQAFGSKLYDKVIERINLPQSRVSYNPAYDLCRESDLVRFTFPKNICSTWKVKSNGDSEVINSFTDYIQAKKFAEYENQSEPFCDDQDILPTIYAVKENGVKLEFRVDYYLKSKEKSAKNFVGSFVYQIPSCVNHYLSTPGIEWIVFGEEYAL